MWGGYEDLSQVGVTIEEIGYGVLSEYTGKGIGTAIVHYAEEISNASILCAWVSEKNKASERCFEKNGFNKREINTTRSLAMFNNEEQRFFLWTIFVNDELNQNADNKCLSSVMGGVD